jgi:hypothetical protein
MKHFAVLNAQNNYVENTIYADTLEIAEAATERTCVELDTPGVVLPGFKYDGTTFIDVRPDTPKAPAE